MGTAMAAAAAPSSVAAAGVEASDNGVHSWAGRVEPDVGAGGGVVAVFPAAVAVAATAADNGSSHAVVDHNNSRDKQAVLWVCTRRPCCRQGMRVGRPLPKRVGV